MRFDAVGDAQMDRLAMPAMAWYGDEQIRLPIPERWRVERSAPPPLPALTSAQTAAALQNPFGTPPLREIAAKKSARSAAVVVEDMTRPTPTRLLIPHLLKELHAAGLDESSIRFVLALGCHRQVPRGELVKKLGANVVGRYETLNHDMTGAFRDLGVSARGVPIRISEPVMSADLKILVGTAYPRGGTGYGGGAKCLVPGVAALETVRAYHQLPGGEHLNPESEMRNEIEEAARTAGVDFIVNAVLNGKREIIGLFAGDAVQAHRAAAERVNQTALARIVPNAEVVISNAYPFDTNLRYTWRGSWAFQEHPDALCILIAHCPEGAGYHQHFKAGGLPFAPAPASEPSFHLYSPMVGPREVNEVLPNVRHHGAWESVLRLVDERCGSSPKAAFYPHAGIGWRASE